LGADPLLGRDPANHRRSRRSGGSDRPILDTSFQGLGSLDFAPAARVAYNFSETWAAALEHYASYGRLSHFDPLNRQQQTLVAVLDYKSDPVSVEFGIGHGFTAASDALVLKMILSRDF
jgi:hypothetical protein